MCHLFGGLTPKKIWKLGYSDFRDLAHFADEWVKSRKEQ